MHNIEFQLRQYYVILKIVEMLDKDIVALKAWIQTVVM